MVNSWKADDWLFVAAFILCMIAAGCTEQEPDIPKAAGQIPVVDSLIQQEIDAGNIPGAVVRIQQGDSILHRKAYGYAQLYEYGLKRLDEPEVMTEEHLFDLASLTKVTATTFGIMLLVAEGKIRLDDPVHKWLIGFDDEAKKKVTVRHLLSHSAGLYQWYPLYYKASNKEERYQLIADMPLKWPVGEGRHYSDFGFMLLGDIIEHISGQSIDAYLQENLYQPLNLQRTTFDPLKKGFDQIAATSHGNPFEKYMVYDDSFGYEVDVDPDSWNGWREHTLRGEVNDGNAWYANGGIAGHAGLFSTADDLQKLAKLLLNKGQYKNKSLIPEAIIDTFLTKDRYGNALGWAMDKQFIAAKGSPEQTYGHTGFTGTSIVIVPEYGLSIILLTNRQNVGVQESGYYYNLKSLRQGVLDVVLAEVNVNLE